MRCRNECERGNQNLTMQLQYTYHSLQTKRAITGRYTMPYADLFLDFTFKFLDRCAIVCQPPGIQYGVDTIKKPFTITNIGLPYMQLVRKGWSSAKYRQVSNSIFSGSHHYSSAMNPVRSNH